MLSDRYIYPCHYRRSKLYTRTHGFCCWCRCCPPLTIMIRKMTHSNTAHTKSKIRWENQLMRRGEKMLHRIKSIKKHKVHVMNGIERWRENFGTWCVMCKTGIYLDTSRYFGWENEKEINILNRGAHTNIHQSYAIATHYRLRIEYGKTEN